MAEDSTNDLEKLERLAEVTEAASKPGTRLPAWVFALSLIGIPTMSSILISAFGLATAADVQTLETRLEDHEKDHERMVEDLEDAVKEQERELAELRKSVREISYHARLTAEIMRRAEPAAASAVSLPPLESAPSSSP